MVTPEEVWELVGRSALGEEVEEIGQEGFYTFRVTRMKDLFKNEYYLFETRNVLGMIDEFSDLYTDSFVTLEEVEEFKKTWRKQAAKEYERVKKKMERRISEYEET